MAAVQDTGDRMSAIATERVSTARVGMVGLIVAEAALFAVFVVAYLYDLGKSLSGPSPREVLSVPIFGTVCLLSSSVTVALAVRALGRGAVRRCGTWLLATVLLAVVFLGSTTVEWVRLITRDGLTIGTNLFGTTFYALVGLHASHVIVGLIMLALIATLAWSRALRPAHVERVELVSWYWHFVEWVRLITRDGLTIGTNLFGTTFYALVGLHASHVIVGLIMLALIAVLAWSRALRPAHVGRVELVSWYWHFVDAVWVVVLTVVYLIGR